MGYCEGKGKKKLELVGYIDSDMAGDVDDRKSTRGMIYFLSHGAICWQSTKQKVVALFSYVSRSSFARPEQAHRNQIPLHPRMCRSRAHQD